ncbi:MAG TPA: intradiol ring-cleavage dioxygenase [Actinophytocola sp.]|uniref:dioxygenase family protein n=1 Tax=Actinophytocola sp. TaxID=1872138 RepID=UPI002DB7F4B1|nr:intradiol ring-cleavage dioxygenase [Actinophytocola sp.]HEU5470284.1 intradiol ring-cleavage dioxygenase [Actinophytocola sp.]
MHRHDRGLAYDLATLRSRRRALTLFGGAGLAVLAGCTSGEPADPATAAPAPTAGGGPVEEIPAETGGPFPGDGSNGPNVLTESGVVRADIRSSIGSASGVADGVPLRLDLTVLEADTGDALAGAAVYVWQCDREGRYSMYSPGATGENYLRGVQAADDSGRLAFTSIFPAAYSGRWPHIHFEVYRSLGDATAGGTKIITSQLALPEEVCRAVYGGPGYDISARNFARTDLSSDTVFRDGHARQLAQVTGDVGSGLTATLAIPV